MKSVFTALSVNLLCGLLVSACGLQGTEPTPKIEINWTSTATTRATTLPPTATMTVTPVMEASATSSLAPTRTLTSTVTPVPNSTLFADASSWFFDQNQTYSSPDGKWVAVTNIFYPRLEILDQEGTFIRGIELPGTYDTVGYVPDRWSQDGEALYFTIYVPLDGGCLRFFDGMGYHRLDLQSGDVESILSGGDFSGDAWGDEVVTFSLSPDETIIAYPEYVGEAHYLTLRYLATGEYSHFLLPGYGYAGSILWAPRQTDIFLSLIKDACSVNEVWSIGRINIQGDTLEILVDGKEVFLYPVGWVDDGIILVNDDISRSYYLEVDTKAFYPEP